MWRFFTIGCIGILLAIACLLGKSFAAEPEKVPAKNPAPAEFSAESLEFFEKQVRPILVNRCYECHSGKSEKLQGGLRLDSRAHVLKGGDTGPAAVPGKVKEGYLVDAINHGDVYKMPPKTKLPAAEIAVLTKWVEMGVPWPKEAAAMGSGVAEFDLAKRKSEHWCWQPLRVVAPPVIPGLDVSDAEKLTPIDRFIRVKLAEKKIAPAAPADRRTLARRLYFDLTGIPPTPAEMDAFLADRSPQAVEKLVDALLASPRFGERWGRHWLDLVRYAESRGHEFDYNIPNAWQYRDYVIRALNADVPYDQFVTEHIAGDLLAKPRTNSTTGGNESILATGYWFLGEWVHSPVDTKQDEMDRFDNMIDVTTKTFLGLTVSCARCHDHKFDAISQKDYYALTGFLLSSTYRLTRFETMLDDAKLAKEFGDKRRAASRAYAKAFAEAGLPNLERMSDYLLAARELILSKKSHDEAAVRKLAEQKKLKESVLQYWLTFSSASPLGNSEPLYLWQSVLSKEQPSDETKAGDFSSALAEVRKSIVKSLSKQDDYLAHSKLVIDYSDPKVPWIVEGIGMGDAARLPGEIDFDNSISEIPFIVRGEARIEPLLLRQQALKPNSERDVVRLNGWERAGRTIRTPSFQIEHDTAYYLVRGAGVAYAVVDSHRINEGPLHGSMLMRWKAHPKGEAQWISHSLKGYRGRVCHIEFSPIDEEFAVHKVIQASRQPEAELFQVNPLMAELFTKTDSPDALAKGIESLYRKSLELFGRGEIAHSENPIGYAHLVQLLLGRMNRSFPDARPLNAEHPAFKIEQSTAYVNLRTFCETVNDRKPQQSSLAMAIWDGTGFDEKLLIRGNVKTPGAPVPRRFPTAIAGEKQPVLKPEQGSGRLELAQKMLAPDNPLTSRVMVNRVWHHLFGRGIVGSVDNFGVLGELPTHPELLDYLADEFRRDGWSVKRLIRRMVLSQTYQQSSKTGKEAAVADPQNLHLHRARIRRLEGEAIRDSILAISGKLNETQFGPSVPVHLTPFMEGRGRPGGGPIDGAGRRSIYISVRRNFLSPMMLAFDTPGPFSTMGRRNVSNVPAQALILMNDPFVTQQAELWAKRILAMPKLSDEQRIEQFYLTGFARPPSAEEVSAGLAFVKQHSEEKDIARDMTRVWADLAHVLLNVKEFIYIY